MIVSRRTALGACAVASSTWMQRLYGRTKATAFALIGDRYHNSDYIRTGLRRTIDQELGVSVDFCDEVTMLDAETLGICTTIPPGWLRFRPVAVAATLPSTPTRLIEYVVPPSMMKSLTTTPSGSAAEVGVAEGDAPLVGLGDAPAVAVCDALGLECELDTGPGPQLTARTISSGAAQRIRAKRRTDQAVTRMHHDGKVPAWSTSRLMVLVCGPLEVQNN